MKHVEAHGNCIVLHCLYSRWLDRNVVIDGLPLICMHALTRSASQKWLTLWLQHCADPDHSLAEYKGGSRIWLFVGTKMRCGISNWRFSGNGLTMQCSETAAHAAETLMSPVTWCIRRLRCNNNANTAHTSFQRVCTSCIHSTTPKNT